MARSVTFLVLVIGVACTGGCGSDFETGVTLTFSLDVEGAAKEGRVPAYTPPAAVLDETVAVIRQRLEGLGFDEFRVRSVAEDRFVVELPASDAGREQEIVSIVSTWGCMEFAIEVLPKERYPPWGADGSARTPPRLAQPPYPWHGTAAEFDEYKAAEVALWRDARDTATAYRPSDARYFVMPREDTDATHVDHFHVMERPGAGELRFDGRIIRNARTSREYDTARPVVIYDIALEYQNVFATWTEKNLGLPVAILLNEQYRIAPTIQSVLSDSVQITLGDEDTDIAARAAQRLATVLQTGALRVMPRFESVEHQTAKEPE